MDNISYVLFPHTQITARNLKKIISRFGHLMICQPWFKEEAILDTAEADLSSVYIQYPSEALKPEENFSKLIDEYRNWMRQNQDKGFGNFLNISQKESLTEDTPWEIRQMISKGAEASNSHKAQAFKWHLILHLASEFEESRTQVEEMLNELVNKNSPLIGALEIDPPQRIFETTPLKQTQFQVGHGHHGRIFEAWFGLFGDCLPHDISLITLDPLVITYATELLEPEEKIIRPKMERGEESSSHIKKLPLLPADNSAANDPVLKGLSGKTIILMEDE